MQNTLAKYLIHTLLYINRCIEAANVAIGY